MVLFVNFINAGTIDPNIPDSKYIEHAKNFDSVVEVKGTTSFGMQFKASGVAISPNHVLTAAHVVKIMDKCKIVMKNKEYDGLNFVSHKKFDEDNGTADIAIITIKHKFDLEKYPELYYKKDEKGKECDISGYGATGNFNTGANLSDDKLRAGKNVIDKVNDNVLICSVLDDNLKTDLEFMIATGDSGGGLFIDGKLAGINSCIYSPKSGKMSGIDTESGHTRVSEYIGWIKDNIYITSPDLHNK